jgi:hypothetical protein
MFAINNPGTIGAELAARQAKRGEFVDRLFAAIDKLQNDGIAIILDRSPQGRGGCLGKPGERLA